MRRRTRNIEIEENIGVDMSPLIDSVFLLLIFFLVTTVIKRREKLLPAKLPEQTVSIDKKIEDKTIILSIDKTGRVYSLKNRNGEDGNAIFSKIQNLSEYLQKIKLLKLTIPIRIECERKVPFQKVIDAMDTCKLNGFSSVSIRIREKINK